ncbi:MAG: diaminopimelate decarboxylase [Clostridiales bacterium]|nr:diaminopimelate decarboxylase [Clostridiales bacterium]
MNFFTETTGFYKGNKPPELVAKYGSPLYAYSEEILRQCCRDMAGLIKYPKFKSNFSIKANSNLELLKIVKQEGLHADAMSPGEIHVLLAAGFSPDEIFYVSNNVSAEEMLFAIERGICTSVDSLSQLHLFGTLNPGGKVAVRFNPGAGAGHHEKVITAGKKTKFGVNTDMAGEVASIAKEFGLKIVGINQHIGSLFMEGDAYIEGVRTLLALADKYGEEFQDLEFVDFGGGFGIPYRKQEGQARLELKEFGIKLDGIVSEWMKRYGREIKVKIEPGRYIVAECGVLLGTVYALKQNYSIHFVGTDLGFNVLARPVMYDSHHDIEVYRNGEVITCCTNKIQTIVGNICESGDIIAKERSLSEIHEGDILGVMDAGAYGFAMSSNYNNRLKPTEILIAPDGSTRLIRRRDTLDDLMRNF